jgi:hypothetical protein
VQDVRDVELEPGGEVEGVEGGAVVDDVLDEIVRVEQEAVGSEELLGAGSGVAQVALEAAVDVLDEALHLVRHVAARHDEPRLTEHHLDLHLVRLHGWVMLLVCGCALSWCRTMVWGYGPFVHVTGPGSPKLQ